MKNFSNVRDDYSLVRSIAISVSLYLFARLSQKLHIQTSTNFLCMLPVAVTTNHYLLPVLLMKSCFQLHIMARRIRDSPTGGAGVK